jgi:hypothetical protein
MNAAQQLNSRHTTPAQQPGGQPLSTTQEIEQLLNHDLTLKQLIALSHTVKETTTISSVQQSKLLKTIAKRIWQRSVCEYDGY